MVCGSQLLLTVQIVRVQTPSGAKRYTVKPEDSLESLKLQAQNSRSLLTCKGAKGHRLGPGEHAFA